MKSNKPAMEWVSKKEFNKRIAPKILTTTQKLLIKCAYADLIGAYQNEKRGGGHDWIAHKETILELQEVFPDILDPITDELDE